MIGGAAMTGRPVRTDDANCRRCDDSGVVPSSAQWTPCTCAAGAKVLDQLSGREMRR